MITVNTTFQALCEGKSKSGFVADISGLSERNRFFRKVLYTAKHCQLVVMSLNPKEDIGEEVHTVDQFFRVESGSGEARLNGNVSQIKEGSAVIVPAGTRHNIINTGKTPLKLYTLYCPPHHRDGVVHYTKKDALKDKEHYDGRTTEA